MNYLVTVVKTAAFNLTLDQAQHILRERGLYAPFDPQEMVEAAASWAEGAEIELEFDREFIVVPDEPDQGSHVGTVPEEPRSPLSMTEAELGVIMELRRRGFAAVVFHPEEIEGVKPHHVEDAMCHSGWAAIESLK